MIDYGGHFRDPFLRSSLTTHKKQDLSWDCIMRLLQGVRVETGSANSESNRFGILGLGLYAMPEKLVD